MLRKPIIAILLLCSIAMGIKFVVAGCIEPNYPVAPVWVDANLIEGDLLGTRVCWEANEPLACSVPLCDPDLDNQGYICNVTCATLGLEVNFETTEQEARFGIPKEKGTHYVIVSMTDIPAVDLPVITTDDPVTKTGTIVVRVDELPVNHGPVLSPVLFLE